jgi:hypothetical protein
MPTTQPEPQPEPQELTVRGVSHYLYLDLISELVIAMATI